MAFTKKTSSSLLTVASIALLNLVSAQNIVPTSPSSSFPSCAVNCAVLLQAQTACIPPNVAATDQITYENCFCQSASLQPLYSTPDAICAGECNTAESDRETLQSWFLNFCKDVGQGIDPLTASPTATAGVTVTSSGPSETSDTGSGSAPAPAPASSSSSSNKSWISGHWQWILMVAVLIVGLSLFAWGLVWFKRRHNRKLEARRHTVSGFPPADEKRGTRTGTPDLWGPHQHMNHTQGWEYSDSAITGSGALAATSNRDDNRRSKRLSSAARQQRDGNEMAEFGSRPAASRRHSSSTRQATARGGGAVADPEMASADRSRSRSQRGGDAESDFERQSDQEHQRRLREVRGLHRKRTNDQ